MPSDQLQMRLMNQSQEGPDPSEQSHREVHKHLTWSVLDANPVAAWLLTGVVTGSLCFVVESKACVSGFGSMCNKVAFDICDIY